jgi:hypothetical protein
LFTAFSHARACGRVRGSPITTDPGQREEEDEMRLDIIYDIILSISTP